MLGNPFSGTSAVAAPDATTAAAVASPATSASQGPISAASTNGTTTPNSQPATPTELPRPYKCPMCAKAFHRLEHQTRHIRTHTGEKPHGCTFPGCSKRFSRSDELTRHARIHTNPNARRQNRAGAAASTGASGKSSVNVSPDHSPKLYPMAVPTQHGPGSIPSRQSSGHEYDEMHVLAAAASQQLEQDRSRQSGHGMTSPVQNHSQPAQASHHYNTYQPSQYRHATFASPAAGHHNGGGYANGLQLPFNRPTLSMSRQHSNEDDDRHHDAHRSKRSRPGSPVLSTAPTSPALFPLHHGHPHSPTPEHTPLVTPAHSPRLHPREVDALHGIHLPSIRQLSLRGTPPTLAALEVDPFQPGSGYSSPKEYGRHHHHHQPVNAMRLSDILESTQQSERTLPVPRVSIHDLVSTSPPQQGQQSGSGSGSSGQHSEATGSRSASHTNLRELA